MPTPTEDTKSSFWKSARWLWAIAIVVVVLLILNQHYQWFPWPWLQTPPSPKKVAESKVMKQIPPAPVMVEDKATEEPAPPPAKVEDKATEGPAPPPAKVESKVTKEPAPAPVIDYEKIKKESDKDLKELVRKRKKEFGVDKSVDMVVKSGEHIRVGKEIVPLDRILAEIETQKREQPTTTAPLQRPQVAALSQPARPDIERTIPKAGQPSRPLTERPRKEPVGYYGVYVVRQGDNLWNIHFAFLREYFDSKGIRIVSDADEPIGSRSSGIGRILKYAESMVHIFNIKTKKLSRDLDLLSPQEKIVIFNLSSLDEILAPLTAEKIDIIHFDGRDLILSQQ